jgi:DNA-binding NarL/FixJ family response regulator
MYPVSRANSSDDEIKKRAASLILLVGSSFKHCRSMARAVESELEDVVVAFAESPADLAGADAGFLSGAQLVIVDRGTLDHHVSGLRALREAVPRVVFSVAYDESTFCAETIVRHLDQRHVTSAVPMNMQLDKWLSAIRLMLAGEDYVPVNLMRMMGEVSSFARGRQAILLPKPLPEPKPGRLDGITRRESDVLKLVADGHQNKEIAARLGLSEHTVKLHIHHIFAKLGAHNRTQAVKIYFG